MSTQQTTLRLGPTDQGRAISANNYQVAEWERPWKYERSAGRLIVMSPDSAEHDDCSEPIRDLLGAYKLAHPEVMERVVSEAWIRHGEMIDRIADIGVYLVGTKGQVRRPERIPELVFEVVSPGSESRDRDYFEKRADYHRCGVAEYVVIDRFRRTATVFTSRPAGYADRVLIETEAYSTPLLPGLVIPLSTVF